MYSIASHEVWKERNIDIISKNEKTRCTLKSPVLGINLTDTDTLEMEHNNVSGAMPFHHALSNGPLYSRTCSLIWRFFFFFFSLSQLLWRSL